MKLLRAIVAFFADDLLTAGMVIVWIALTALASRFVHPGIGETLVYLIGMIAILAFGAIRRAKTR